MKACKKVKFRLTTVKPLHASWVCNFYHYLASSKGEVIIEDLESGLPLQSIHPLVDQADLFLKQDATSIYSSLDSDQLQEYTRMI